MTSKNRNSKKNKLIHRKYNYKYTRKKINKNTDTDILKNTDVLKSKKNISNSFKNLDLENKELSILRNAVDIAEKIKGKQLIKLPEIKNIIKIVEEFIKNKKLICYGGIAINNLLPENDRFYNFDIELPDYDFYSSNALNDAKELADLYSDTGYTQVEAKAGLHYGTYKIFVNYIPVADITQIDDILFNNIKKDAIEKNGILYCPVNFLKMSMYLELSSPKGDISRWEKILKRLILLNKYYPLYGTNCDINIFSNKKTNSTSNNIDNINIYNLLKETLIKNNVVFLGAFAYKKYSQYGKNNKYIINDIPDFDILSIDPEKLIHNLKYTLIANNYNNIKIRTHSGIGELIPEHYEFIIDNKPYIYIYKPLRCHSYNILNEGSKKIRIATIDTMLSFYLSFLYSNKNYYNSDKILCMTEYLLNIQNKNKFKQSGILKRFSITCYGTQKTREDLLSEKAIKFEELKNKEGSHEFKRWFFKYVPKKSIELLKKNRDKYNNKTKKSFVTKTIYERKDYNKSKKIMNTPTIILTHSDIKNDIKTLKKRASNLSELNDKENKIYKINKFINNVDKSKKIGNIEY
jgi:hypothetical protein